MTPYYELHVTFVSEPDGTEPPSSIPRGWKFSRIDGDPVLGDGIKSYLTRQLAHKLGLAHAKDLLDQAADKLKVLGYQILRKKVELVVYDARVRLQ